MQPGGMVFISVKREHSLQIGLDSPPDGTTSLLAKKESTLNAVLQYHGIAYHWKTLTDALGRAFAAEWKDASDITGMPGSRGGGREVLPRDTGGTGVDSRSPLPAFPGEKAAAGLEPGSKQTPAPRIESNGQMCFSFSLSRDTSSSLEAIVAKLEDRREGLFSPMEKQLLGGRGGGDLPREQLDRCIYDRRAILDPVHYLVFPPLRQKKLNSPQPPAAKGIA